MELHPPCYLVVRVQIQAVPHDPALDHEGRVFLADSVEVKRVANKWMSSAAKSAPMCAEAVLHEELRTACSPGWQGQVGLEAQLLASFSTSTSRGQLTGLQALSRKLYYSGVVSGLEVRLPLPRARHLLKLSEHCFASEGFQPCSCFGRVVNLLQQRFLAARGKWFGPSRNCLADFGKVACAGKPKRR
jgi:hypothetical protein